MRRLCKWCGEPIDEVFYPDQDPNTCTGCHETLMDEEEFVRANGGDFEQGEIRESN
jgi:CRISPR/Cas system-associated protein Cas10 (large subunit of type III CRISPR-Cas system)